MNWKDAPHLFANGKFKAIKKGGYLEAEYKPDMVYGCKYGSQFYLRTYDEFVNIDKCQLIARPISDMTDEECREITGIDDIDIEILREYIQAGSISDIKITLLSIGVYPFGNDTDVIFKPTNS